VGLGLFTALRFLVGVAIGSEWVTGASIVSELWPDRARGRGVGLMQCGFGIGFFVASFAGCFSSIAGRTRPLPINGARRPGAGSIKARAKTTEMERFPAGPRLHFR
jgi:MFS family permease